MPNWLTPCAPPDGSPSPDRVFAPSAGQAEHSLFLLSAAERLQYARDLAYVTAIGEIDSTFRTSEQSEIAQFWYEDSTLGWNRITSTIVRQRRLDQRLAVVAGVGEDVLVLDDVDVVDAHPAGPVADELDGLEGAVADVDAPGESRGCHGGRSLSRREARPGSTKRPSSESCL